MSTHTFVTEDFLAKFPKLLAVSTYGAGYDSVDVEACTRAGVAVMCQAGANRDSVAEHTIALLLSVVHRIGEQDRRMRVEKLTRREDIMGREVKGMTLGLVGMGQVGTRVAEMAPAVRDERDRDGSLRGAGGDSPARRRARVARGAHRPLGHRLAALSARQDDHRHVRRGAIRGDEARGVLRDHGSRRHSRRARVGRGACFRAISRAPAWTCGSRSRRRSTTRCFSVPTSSRASTPPA
jgi:hypothetical protein